LKNSKLASVLSKLSKTEFKNFVKFVKSPYYNSNAKIISIVELIAKYFPVLESEKLSKENIYKHIYPKEKYNDSTARGLLSSTLKMAEDFLVAENIKNHKYKYKDALLTELCHREVHDLFNINAKTVRNELEKIKYKDESEFFMGFRLETLINYTFSRTYIPLTQKDIPGDSNTNDTDNLINYFLIIILSRYNYLLTKTGSLNIKMDFKLFDEIIDYLSKTDLQHLPALNFQYNRAMLYRSGMDEKYFHILKKILYEDMDKLDRQDMHNLFGTLQNYSVVKNRQRADKNYEDHFELIQFAIKNDLLAIEENEPVHPVLFSNVVNTSLQLKKVKEAKDFIFKYKDRLLPERVDTAFNFNIARVYQYEKKYDEALSSLALAQNEDVFYKLSIKNAYAQIYYEKGFIEELIFLLDTYKSLVNSNILINDSLKEGHLNFISLLYKIIKLKSKKDKNEIEYLKHEAAKIIAVTEKIWLMEKIDELLETI